MPPLQISGEPKQTLWCAPLKQWCSHLGIALPTGESLEDTAARAVEVIGRLCASESKVTVALNVPFLWQDAFSGSSVKEQGKPFLRTTDREIARITGLRVVPWLEGSEKLGEAAELGSLIVAQLTGDCGSDKFALNLFGRNANPPLGRRVIEVFAAATLFSLTGAVDSGLRYHRTQDALAVVMQGVNFDAAAGLCDALISAFTAFLSQCHRRPHLFFKPIESEEVSDREFAEIAREGWIWMPKPLPESNLRRELLAHLRGLALRLISDTES